jgi:uncharacterized glyoxalase superfamily protein PhnB
MSTGGFIPGMRYRDANRAIEFLCEAFGFEKQLVVPGENDTVAHAQLKLGAGMIMLGSYRAEEPGMDTPNELGTHTQANYTVVEDVDAHCEHARAAGAVIAVEPMDPEYGGRMYSCKDLEGHMWHWGTYDPFAE